MRTIEDVFAYAYSICPCDDPNCGVVVTSPCHPEAGLEVKFFRTAKVLGLRCKECDTPIEYVALAAPSEPSAPK